MKTLGVRFSVSSDGWLGAGVLTGLGGRAGRRASRKWVLWCPDLEQPTGKGQETQMGLGKGPEAQWYREACGTVQGHTHVTPTSNLEVSPPGEGFCKDRASWDSKTRQ